MRNSHTFLKSGCKGFHQLRFLIRLVSLHMLENVLLHGNLPLHHILQRIWMTISWPLLTVIFGRILRRSHAVSVAVVRLPLLVKILQLLINLIVFHRYESAYYLVAVYLFILLFNTLKVIWAVLIQNLIIAFIIVFLAKPIWRRSASWHIILVILLITLFLL